MKKFSDMEIDEVINVINDNKTLRDMLDRYIQDCSDVSISKPLTILSAFSTAITSL